MSAKSERLVLIGSDRTENNELASAKNVVRTINKSTSFCICDATSPDFFPGRNLPSDWVRDLDNGPWCFLPLYFLDEPDYGGSFLEELRQFPMSYSTGFASREEALEACKDWMKNNRWLKNIRIVDWEVYQSLTEEEEPESDSDPFCDDNDEICYCGQKF